MQLALETEEGGREGMQVATRNGRRQGNRFFCRAHRKEQSHADT